MSGQQPSTSSTQLNQRLDIDFALQAVGVGVWDLDITRQQVWWDDRCKQMYGFKQGDIVPYPQVLQYMHPDDQQRVDQAVQWALNPQSNGHYDMQFRTVGASDGQLRWLHCRGQAFFDEQGQAYRFSGIAQEVTQLVQAQQQIEASEDRYQQRSQDLEAANQELSASNEALVTTNEELVMAHRYVEESEAHFRTMVEQAPVAMAVFRGNNFVIETANKAHLQLWGRQAQQVVGRPLFEALPEAAGHGYEELLAGVMSTGELFYAHELSAPLLRNGQVEQVYFNFVYQPLRELDGTITGVSVVANEITEQVNARHTIEASEARFRSLIEEAPVATCLYLGRELRIEVINEAMIRIFGKGPSVLGKPLAVALPELAGQPFLQLLDEVFTSGQLYEAQATPASLVVDGVLGTFYFDFSFKPLRNAEGQVYAILEMATDVTQRVLAQQKVEHGQQQIFAAIDNLPNGLGVFVMEGPALTFRVVNPYYCQLTGYQPEQVIGRPLLEVRPEHRDQPYVGWLKEVMATGKPITGVETPGKVLRNGQLEEVFTNFAYSPYYQLDGTISGVIGMFVDVTAQVQSRQAIEQSDAFARNLFQSSPVANLVLLGADMRIEAVNEGMLQMLGRDRSIVGQPFMSAVPELQPTPLLQRLQQVLTTAEVFHQPEERIDLVRFGQPYTGYFHYLYTPLTEPSGLTVGVVVTAIEVTTQVVARQMVEESEAQYRLLAENLEEQVQARTEELAAANEELAASNEELIASNEDITASNQALETANTDLLRSNQNLEQFAYIASHDLQEPLRKIQSFGDLLKTRYATTDGEELVYIERMQQAAARMSVLIKDLLAFSRISTRQAVAEDVPLTQLVNQVLDTLSLPIEESGAQFLIEPLPVVQGDRHQLDQLFQNLLSNALKFVRKTSTGERVPPQITIRANVVARSELPGTLHPSRYTEAYQRIEVIDNGIGFDEKYLDRIFQVFQRLHGKNEFAGTGVGLAIVQKVVTNHGGAITASGQPNQGATFSVYLPA